MIWREIRISVLILALCILAALATATIYEHASDSITSAWLLLPVFILIAVAIVASEFFLTRAGANDSVQVSVASPTWPLNQTPAIVGLTVVLYVLSFPPELPQAMPQSPLQATEVSAVATIPGQAVQVTEATNLLARRA